MTDVVCGHASAQIAGAVGLWIAGAWSGLVVAESPIGRAIRKPFAWRLVDESGVWGCYENAVTGERMARRVMAGGYSPYPDHWIRTGNWDDAPKWTPWGGSGLKPPPVPPAPPPTIRA